LAHVITQGNGSGADIAASSFTGMIEYTSFQAEWLLKAYKKSTSITQLIESEWKYLSIKELSLPESVQLVVGWTGSPASTKSLVKQLRKLKDQNIIDYKSFLTSSKEAVDYILEGLKTNNQNFIYKVIEKIKEAIDYIQKRIKTNNQDAIYKGIEKNRKALALVGQRANVEIETAKLYVLSRAAKNVAGAGKLSGVGCGDCGIAFIPTHSNIDELKDDWKQNKITPLNLTIYKR